MSGLKKGYAELDRLSLRQVGDIVQRHQATMNINAYRRLDQMCASHAGPLPRDTLYIRSKRTLDLLLCVIALPIVLLPMACIALAIKIDSKGPALFRQNRLGLAGRSFRLVKFRTMEQRPNQKQHEDAAGSHDGRRITRLGHFLRRSRLDELPQIWNVLRGEMSWIGPRPETEILAARYEERVPFYSCRHRVRPGITGWAQVNQGPVVELAEVRAKLRYDMFYIDNMAWRLDFAIMIKTTTIMIKGAWHR